MNPSRARIILAVLLVAVGVAAGAGWLWWLCARNVDIAFLTPCPPAEWIVYPTPIDLKAHAAVEMDAVFERAFSLEAPPSSALLRWRGFRRCGLRINGQSVELPGEPQPAACDAGASACAEPDWKRFRRCDVTKFLRVGRNEIVATVVSDSGHPALWLSLAVCGPPGRPLVEINSDAGWRASLVGASWQAARLASMPMLLGRHDPATTAGWVPLKTTADALRHEWPMVTGFALLAVAIVLGVNLWRRRRATGRAAVRELPTARHMAALIGVLALAWVVLFANNVRWLYPGKGFDVRHHLAYVQYVLDRGTLPSAADGWETYQPPLFYVTSAAILGAWGLDTRADAAAACLRVLTMACGIAQFVLIFCCLRELFPGQARKQLVGLVVAAFLPMHIYLSHYVTNEGLAAMLVTAALYLCLRIVRQECAATRLHVWLGLCLGAALLAKFSAVVALPVVLVVIVGRLAAARERRFAEWCRTAGLTVAVCLAICGWHFGRVWVLYGKPLVGNWDRAAGFGWWQDPGYHTASYYLSFGQSWVQPIFSAFCGFGDALYSTLWGDGFCAGAADLRYRPPWNYDLMAVGYLLAAAISVMVLAGVVAAIAALVRRPQAQWFLMIGLAFLTVAAVFYMTLKLPYYGQAKAFYGMAAAAPLAAFAAWGFDLPAGRSRWLRGGLWALVITWAFTSYSSFWINGSDPRTPTVYGLDLAFAGRHREALERYGEALKLDGRFADAWFGAGESFAALGKDTEALRHFQECLRHNPRDAICHAELAELLAKQRRTAEALASAERAAEVAPDHPVAYHLLGLLLAGQGRPQEAVVALREAVRMVPDSGSIHADLAKVYARQGEYRQAYEQFTYARRMSPNDVATKLIMAWFLATCPEDSVRNGQLAAQLAEEVLRQQGEGFDPVLAFDSLAAGYAEAGRFEEAVKVAGRLVEELEGARRTEQAAKVRARLELYKARKPYRDIKAEQKAP